jgi:ribose transport system permease protein
MTDILEQPQIEAPHPGTRRPRPPVSWDIGIVIAFWILISVAFGIDNGSFWTQANFLAIGSTGVVLGLLSLGQTAVIIIGGFDLSVGGVAALGGVSYVMLSNDGFPTAAALAFAVLIVGGSVGLLNAVAINVVRINALIATLGTMSITSGIANILSNGLTVSLNNNNASFLDDTTVADIPIYIWVVIGLFFVGSVLLIRMTAGRSLYVIGGNRTAARLAGLRVTPISMAVYVVCGMLAALAGIVASSQLTAASPTVDSSTTLLSITAVVLGGGSLAGGEGSAGGTLVGVLLLATLSDGLAITGVQSFYQDLATGVVLLLAVGASSLRNRRKRRT